MGVPFLLMGPIREEVAANSASKTFLLTNLRLASIGEVALLAEDLIGPFHQCHQIGRRHEPRVLAFEVVIADRTGP